MCIYQLRTRSWRSTGRTFVRLEFSLHLWKVDSSSTLRHCGAREPNYLDVTQHYFRCVEEKAGEGKKIVEITCDHQGEYEAQLELATKTEQEYERKARSRIGINDYVSTIWKPKISAKPIEFKLENQNKSLKIIVYLWLRKLGYDEKCLEKCFTFRFEDFLLGF